MADNVIVETPDPTPAAEETAQEKLADVACAAIDETAERIEALARATERITGFEGDISELREAFRAHVEGNQVDFLAVAERLTTLETGMAVMAEAVNKTSDDVEDMAADTELAIQEQADDIVDSVIGAADVVEAEKEESPIESILPEVKTETSRGRRFIRI